MIVKDIEELIDRKRRISKLEKKELRDLKQSSVLACIEESPIPIPASLTTEDFPLGLFKQSSFEREYQGPSFASMTKKPASDITSPKHAPVRLLVDENENEISNSIGWTLDLEEMLLGDDNSKNSSHARKKSSKKMSLLSNGSARRRA